MKIALIRAFRKSTRSIPPVSGRAERKKSARTETAQTLSLYGL